MKAEIHPTYHSDATVHCAGCGRTFTIGSTAQQIHVELCSNCHPFYTGKQKLVDTAGRVDRFRARQAKAADRAEKPTDESVIPAEGSPSTEERLAEMKQNLENQ